MRWLSLGLSFVPASLFLLTSLVGSVWSPPAKLQGAVQHGAAGIVLAAVALELLPAATDTYAAISGARAVCTAVGAFVVAIVGLNIVARFSPCAGGASGDEGGHGGCCSASEDAGCGGRSPCSPSPCYGAREASCGSKAEAGACGGSSGGCGSDPSSSLLPGTAINVGVVGSQVVEEARPLFAKDWAGEATFPWTVVIAVAIDIALDGMLSGIAFLIGNKAGVGLIVAFSAECLVMGLVLTMRLKKASRLAHAGACLAVAACFPSGNALGDTVLSHVEGYGKLFILSFGVGALLYLATDDLLLEARENKATVTWYTTIFLPAGFVTMWIVHMAG